MFLIGCVSSKVRKFIFILSREQILGKEARAKVPEEFIVQHNRYGTYDS